MTAKMDTEKLDEALSLSLAIQVIKTAQQANDAEADGDDGKALEFIAIGNRLMDIVDALNAGIIPVKETE